jgi:quercetin dioxygenase-like cupin family protein
LRAAVMQASDPAATPASPFPPSLDAMVAAPAHHVVLLENDEVRVLDTRLEPGQRTPVHTHRWPSVLYVIGWSDFVRRAPDGTVLVDSRDSKEKPGPGTTIWSAPLPPHSAENVGDGVLRVIAVELKRAGA